MAKMKKEVKIGIAFIVAISILYFGINFLKGINLFTPTNSYIVVFDDVTGLLKADPVTINGFKVGQVFEMQLNPNDPSSVLVYMHLDKGVELPVGSKIDLDASMLGSATLIIEPDMLAKNYYVPGDTLLGTKKSGLMDVAARVVPQVENLLPKIDSILSGIQALVNNPALSSSLDNVNIITGDLASSTKEINMLVSSLNKDLPVISGRLASASTNFEGLTTQFKAIDLISTYNSMDSTMKNVQYLSTKLITKDNSLGLLLNDRQLYDSLNSTVGNASLLLKDVRENPSRYINVKVF